MSSFIYMCWSLCLAIGKVARSTVIMRWIWGVSGWSRYAVMSWSLGMLVLYVPLRHWARLVTHVGG